MATINAVGVGLSGQTGTGSFAGSDGPTFVAPVLGTPASGTLTNTTGLPVPGGLSATGTPSSTTYLDGAGTWSVPGGGASAATKTDQTTGTSTTVFVNPGVQQYHNSAVKAWAFWNASPSLVASYNVTSVSFISTGLSTVNLTVSFTTANYCVTTGVNKDNGTNPAYINVNSTATNNFDIQTR